MKRVHAILSIVIGFCTYSCFAQCNGEKGPNVLGAIGTFSSPFITVNTAASGCISSGSNSYNPVENVGAALAGCSPGISTACSEYIYTAEKSGLTPPFRYSILKTIGDNSGGNCIKGDWRGKEHTEDGGYFMAINGAPANSSNPVFYQISNIPVCIGATYEFSAWITNLLPKTNGNAIPGSEPNISLKVNGVAIKNSGPIAYSNTSVWIKVTGTFKASTPVVDLQMITVTSVFIGNDFGIDDISLNKCQPQSIIDTVLLSFCDKASITSNEIVSDILKTNTFYEWQISTGKGTSFIAANPSLVSKPGVYRMIVSNTCGSLDTTIFMISLNPKPAIGPDKVDAICQGGSVNLTSNFNVTGLSSSWTLDSIVLPNPTFINTSGFYQIVVTNSNGCRDTAFVGVVVNPAPNLGLDKKITICSGNSIDLTKQYTTDGLTTEWTMEAIEVTDPSLITSQGMYKLIVTNSFGCADTAIVNVIVNPGPTLVTKNPIPVCFPSTVDLSVAIVKTGTTAGVAFTYWQNAGTTIPFTNPGSAGNGIYFIKATDSNGCFAVNPVTAIVYSAPVVNAGRDTTICDQSYAILKGKGFNLAEGTATYSWSPGNGLTRPDSSVTIATARLTTIYTLKMEVNYGSCILSATDDIRVDVRPPVPAFAGDDTSAVEGTPHQLNAIGGVAYSWSPARPLNNPAIPNPVAIVKDDTRFKVKVSDIAGCSATDSILIKVYDMITYYLPNAFSPNGDGLNDVFRPFPVGIVSTDWFRIYNRYGNIMFETARALRGWDGTTVGKSQPPGNYIWTIKGVGKNGQVIEKKGNVVLVR